MSIRILLDRKLPFYSNNDWISGKVEVDLPFPTQISYITVKLEGVSKSHITAPKHPDRPDKKKTYTELHKLLYLIENVLPPNPTPNTPWTIYGTHYYPFRFQFPMGNDCLRNLSKQAIGLGDIFDSKNMHNASIAHVTSLLPPTFDEYPADGAIYYFLKVTAVRPQFYKENYRAGVRLKFAPLPEETVQADLQAEVFAKREHRFAPASSDAKGAESSAPHFSVEIRLPNPPVLSPRGRLPLRILVNNYSESRYCLFLDSMEINLIAHTDFKSHHLQHKEARSSVLLTLSNMRMQVLNTATPANTMAVVDSSLWDRLSLPEKLPSTFKTCNISQTYDFEVHLGFKYGYPDDLRPDTVILTLRHPAKVYVSPQSISDRCLPAPQLPQRPHSIADHDEAPPSYEDAISQGPPPGSSSLSMQAASSSDLALAPSQPPPAVAAAAPAIINSSPPLGSVPATPYDEKKLSSSRPSSEFHRSVSATTNTTSATHLPAPSRSPPAFTSASHPSEQSISPLISLDNSPSPLDQEQEHQKPPQSPNPILDPEAYQIEEDRKLAQRLQDMDLEMDRRNQGATSSSSSNPPGYQQHANGSSSGEVGPPLPRRSKHDHDLLG